MDTTKVKTEYRGRPPQSRGPMEWETVKILADEGSGLMIEVQVLRLGRPKFSIAVGTKGERGLSRFIKPNAAVANAVVSVAKTGMTLARLMDEALLFVESELQKLEDDFIERKQVREMRQIEGGPKETKGLSKFSEGSKTEREAEKRARHEHNVEARRAADQQRTSNSKSGRK